MNEIVIREIRESDNEQIGQLIREVLLSLNVPQSGTAYADPHLNRLFSYYRPPGRVYHVLEKDGKLLGGGGIAPLEGGPTEVCELQKMYFLEAARGQGLGSRLLSICLEKAAEFGYKQCYLETMPNMLPARKLYLKHGFSYLKAPMGSTGHTSCQLWMHKELSS